MRKGEKKKLYYDKVISLYRDKKMNCYAISKLVPISRLTVKKWIEESYPEAFIHSRDEYDMYHDRVIELHNSGCSRKEIARKIPVKLLKINNWIHKYLAKHPESRRKHNKDIYYSQAIKLHIEGMGASKISKIIPVSVSTLNVWFRTFAHDNAVKSLKSVVPVNEKEEGDMGKKKESTFQDIESMKKEIEALKKRLSEETMRADAFNELINVAEKQFNISIRKKAGTKQ